ncbi:MAG: cell division protein FtsQ/DivIB [Rhodobiaceae bacterium]|nr:cell division protein FtsQ/DivIB [Rhodobiaceae bacterium]MCC0051482.1 cell division protein FtsQ/DivIB [Rhodobiaceae bacterium]MCC0061068.1 cell division protein FtsQ/DivIB [Rhodobiaceae bacterium]
MDGGRRILQQVARPFGKRPAELSSFFSSIPGQFADDLNYLAEQTAPPKRVRSNPRRHAAGAWIDRILDRLSQPKATDIAGQACSVIVLGGAIAMGVVTGGHMEAFGNGLLRIADAAAAASGLRITSVEISGNDVIDDETILDTAGLAPGGSIIGIDAGRARMRLEALPWIASARVQKLFPDRLAVDVVERTPFAVWQHDGEFHIIDRTGVKLRPSSIDQLPDLPIVVGRGAADGAEILFSQLKRYPEVASHVIASVRVADRRWSLHLDRGIEVKLPEEHMEAALERLARLARDGQLLKRDIDLIDMRIADHVFVRPRAGEDGKRISRAEAAS